MHALVDDENVFVAHGDDRRLVHSGGAAAGLGPVSLKAVRNPASNYDLEPVFGNRLSRIVALYVVAIGRGGLADRLIVRAQVGAFLLTVVRGRDAQGLIQHAVARTDL